MKKTGRGKKKQEKHQHFLMRKNITGIKNLRFSNAQKYIKTTTRVNVGNLKNSKTLCSVKMNKKSRLKMGSKK